MQTLSMHAGVASAHARVMNADCAFVCMQVATLRVLRRACGTFSVWRLLAVMMAGPSAL
jgi:hypothetical protein